MSKPTQTLMVLSLFLSFNIEAQINLEWQETYNNGQQDKPFARDMAVDKSGNVFVTGWSYADSTNIDMVTIKYNSSGQEQWLKKYRYSGDWFASPKMLFLDDSSNVYIAGYGGLAQWIVLKYDTDGNLEWTDIRTAQGKGGAFDIGGDGARNVYVTGVINTTECLTVKYDRNGTIIWETSDTASSHGHSGSVHYSFIAVDTNGEVYVTQTGFFENNSSNGFNPKYTAHTIKFDSTGTKQWDQKYFGSSNKGAGVRDIQISPDGSVVLLAYSYHYGGFDYVTIKYTPQGHTQWINIYDYGSDQSSMPVDMAFDQSGNILITGSVYGVNCYSARLGTIKINPFGSLIWDKMYYEPSACLDAFGIEVDSKSNSYVLGRWHPYNTVPTFDIVMVKYDSLGTELWWDTLYTGYTEWPADLELSKNGDLYVFGDQAGLFEASISTMKFNQSTIGIDELNSDFSFKLYPNPITSKAILEFENISSAPHQLSIYDTRGRLVRSYPPITSSKIEIERSDLSSGVYFFHLRQDSEIKISGKFIVR